MSRLLAVVPVLGGPQSSLGLSWTSLHGRPLFVHAARALTQVDGADAVVTAYPGGLTDVQTALADADLSYVRAVQGGPTVGATLLIVLAPTPGESPVTVLVHDPSCPLVPASALAQALEAARQGPDEVTVATRPMTDTVKAVVEGVVHGTVDRDRLLVLSSPVTVPAARLLDLGDALVGCGDLADLVDLLRTSGSPVRWTTAPGPGRRVGSAADVELLEALSRPPEPESEPIAARPAAGRR